MNVLILQWKSNMDFSKMSVLTCFFETTCGSVQGGRWICFDLVTFSSAKTWGPSKPAVCHPNRDGSAWHGMRAQVNHWCHAVMIRSWITRTGHNNIGSIHTKNNDKTGRTLVFLCLCHGPTYVQHMLFHLIFVVPRLSRLAELSLLVLRP